MRLIDVDALMVVLEKIPAVGFKNIDNQTYTLVLLAQVLNIIKQQPTIEERKTGKWTPKENRPKQEVFICSECGGWAYSPWIGSRKTPKPNKCKYSYCPNCGARMSE